MGTAHRDAPAVISPWCSTGLGSELLSSSIKAQDAALGKKNYIYSQVFFHFLKCSMINFPVSSHCRQCLCSFYYLSCSGRGSSVPWVNRSSLRNVSSIRTSLLSSSSPLPPRAAAGREADSCCKPQEDAFLLHPISPLMAGTTTVRVNPSLLRSSILRWMPCGDSLSQPDRMDGVRAGGMLTPPYLSMPGCLNLSICLQQLLCSGLCYCAVH